jgi:carbonic anhydrase
MRRLEQGIRHSQHNVVPTHQSPFAERASGHRPPTLLITCSDSRIVPELITQTAPGELFVLRNAGNIVPPYDAPANGEAATIEYAVKVLKVEDIVVCGHSHCGAITGVLRPETLKDLPAVAEWLVHAEKCREEIVDHSAVADSDDDLLTAAVKSNVLVQLDHLRTYPAVALAESAGELALHGCFYRFETGDFSAFDSVSGKYLCVRSRYPNEATVA